MKRIKVEILVSQTLDNLQKTGVGKKSLKDYKYCGFGPILKYFVAQGVTFYSQTVADSFMQQVRLMYENRDISQWKWTLIRKSAALLENVFSMGQVSFDPLPRWEAVHNPLHQKPSPKQLRDKGNIFALVYRTKQELIKFDLKPKSIQNYTYDGFDAILRYCIKQGITKYSKKDIDRFVLEAHDKYESHLMCRSVYQNIRKMAALLDEYHETDTLKWHCLLPWGLRMPNNYFSNVLELFCKEHKRNGALAVGTIIIAHSAIRRFLFGLEDLGYQDFNTITLKIISDRISFMATQYTGGLNSWLFSIRIFLRFLKDYGITSADLSIAIPELVSPRRVVREGFSADEIDKLLNCVDRDTAVGKRDYAIMMTATQTGLRAVDVTNLRYQDIDWRNNEIHIVQQKTGKALSLPLRNETGNAIADYLLYGRPECDLPYIFLCKDRPYRQLNSRSASTVVSRYMRLAEIANSAIPRRGFHSFRRAFGKRLLESEIPLDMLSELLGHADIDSAAPYLAANETGLKSCALGLIPLEKAGVLL